MQTQELCYDVEKKLHCYVVSPDDISLQNQPRIFVVIVHGGAWMIGSKNSFHSMATLMCHEFNAICVVPDYSLSNIDGSAIVNSKVMLLLLLGQCFFLMFCKHSKQRLVVIALFLFFLILSVLFIFVEFSLLLWRPHNSHPAHVRDIARCMQFTFDLYNKEMQNSKIMLIGHSAGAHLCALLALNDTYLQRDLFDRIAGVVAMSGVYSYWEMQRSGVSLFLDKYIFVGMFNGNLTPEALEAKKTNDPAQWLYITSAWPLFHVSQTVRRTRFFLLTSDTDFSILQHNVEFAKHLKMCGFPVQHVHIPNTTHFSIHKQWNTKHKHVWNDVCQFINKALRS